MSFATLACDRVQGNIVILSGLQAIGDGIPDRVVIAPWGSHDVNGEEYRLDLQAANMVIAEFKAKGVDVPFDYEHTSLNGEDGTPRAPAPATGWITGLEADPGVGLIAKVKWTPLGRKYLEGREYRYCSPVLLVRKSDRRPIRLHSVALVNRPAISGMPAIVSRDHGGMRSAIAQDVARTRSVLEARDTGSVLVASAFLRPRVPQDHPALNGVPLGVDPLDLWHGSPALREAFADSYADFWCAFNDKKAIGQVKTAASTSRPPNTDLVPASSRLGRDFVLTGCTKRDSIIEEANKTFLACSDKNGPAGFNIMGITTRRAFINSELVRGGERPISDSEVLALQLDASGSGGSRQLNQVSRSDVIAKANAEFSTFSPNAQRSFRRGVYIQQALRDADLPPLTDAERSAIPEAF